MIFKLDKKDENVLNLGFMEAQSKIRAYEQRKIKESGLNLTPKELNYLVIIKHQDHLKQNDILNLMDVTKGTFSSMIKQLTTKGFIVQVSSELDKRIKKIVFTDLGNKALELNLHIRKRIKKFLADKVGADKLELFMDIALEMR